MPNFSINANVIAPRLIWVTPQKVLGGDLALHTIVPLVDLEVEAGSRRQRKTGLGDIVVGRLSQHLHRFLALLKLGFQHRRQHIIEIPTPIGQLKRTAGTAQNHRLPR